MLNGGEYTRQIARDGFTIVENVISAVEIDHLREAIANLPAGDEVRRRQDIYGVRNLLELSGEVRDLATSRQIRELVTAVLGLNCFAVRATFFDKVPGANWKLRYHQDSVISVRERIETPGFTAWSTKAGVLQVRPPVEVLNEMLAVRVHLDVCKKSNGPLRILAGSHTTRWAREEISQCKSKFREVTCEVSAGGALVMRPLVLHASSPSDEPCHRRVIHIEFANAELPGQLEWQNRWGSTLGAVPASPNCE